MDDKNSFGTMMPTSRYALLDTGFVTALLSDTDSKSDACKRAFDTVQYPLLPTPILAEVAYLTIRAGDRNAFVAFLNALKQKVIPVVRPELDDLGRAAELMTQYADANIDFVDCVVIAIAERLNIQQILTVDQRDFRMVRPKHTPAFTILP